MTWQYNVSLLYDTQTFQPLNHAPGVFEKSCQIPGDWDLKPGDFQNIHQIKSKRLIIFVMVFFTPLVVSVVLSCRSFGSNGRILFYYPGRQDGE